MTPEQLYEDLMVACKQRDKAALKGKITHDHHIVPRCMNGSDDKSNLVKLTLEEHFEAHKLLAEIFPVHTGIQHAYELMSRQGQLTTGEEFSWWMVTHDPVTRQLAGCQSILVKQKKKAKPNIKPPRRDKKAIDRSNKKLAKSVDKVNKKDTTPRAKFSNKVAAKVVSAHFAK